MFEQAWVEGLEEGVLYGDFANQLLSIYVMDHDWSAAINRLHAQHKRNNREDVARELTREALAFTILLPTLDPTIRIDADNPDNNLFYWQHFHQKQSEESWFKKLQSVIAGDMKNFAIRKELIALGVVDPLEFQPLSRQAYKWLCESAESQGEELTARSRSQFRNFVMAYGGSIVSRVFDQKPYEVRRIPNWRSPYFIEQLTHRSFRDKNEMIRIKKTELDKTNSKWIRQAS